MIYLTLFATLVILALLAWAAVELKHSPRARQALWFVVPIVIAMPFGFYAYGVSLMGKATEISMPNEFELLYSYSDDRLRTVFALVIAKEEREPRLYAIKENYEKNKGKFGQQQGKLARGMPIQGKKAEKGNPGGYAPGDFVFYVLPPTGNRIKEGG
jgi:hypothetical protein